MSINDNKEILKRNAANKKRTSSVLQNKNNNNRYAKKQSIRKEIATAAKEVFEGELIEGNQIAQAEVGLNLALLSIGSFHSRRLERLIKAFDVVEGHLLSPEVIANMDDSKKFSLLNYLTQNLTESHHILASIQKNIDWEVFPTQVDIIFNQNDTNIEEGSKVKVQANSSEMLAMLTQHYNKKRRAEQNKDDEETAH